MTAMVTGRRAAAADADARKYLSNDHDDDPLTGHVLAAEVCRLL